MPHESCTCEICENIKLFVRSLNQHINQKIPEDERKIAETYSCSKENRNIGCNTGNCTICPKIEVCFRGTDGSSSEETASDGDQNSSAINYFKWATVDGKVQKVSCEIERADANDMLKEKVKILKYCLLYTSPSPRDLSTSRMPSSA